MTKEKIERKVQSSGIRYLDQDEKDKTRSLWESCFWEDSKEFVSYYYREKMKENRVLVKWDQDSVIAMLHRNPYQVRFGKQQWDVDYIVGVATRNDRRREGHMGELLTTCLNDMNREHMPFTFLMPVAEEIYRPFSFRFVEKKEEIFLKDKVEKEIEYRSISKSNQECRAASLWMMQWMERHYEMSTVRGKSYLRKLIRELESENGKMEYLIHQGVVIGIQAFWGLNEREKRIMYLEEEWCVKGGKKPRIMARITDIISFLPSFCLWKPGKLILELELEDEQIKAHTGKYLWTITEKGSSLKEMEGNIHWEDKADGWLKADISQLTEWLFGYQKPEKIWKGYPDQIIKMLSQIRTVKSILLDEIV